MNVTTLLPSFASAVQKLHDLLLPVCLVLAFAGLIYKITSLMARAFANIAVSVPSQNADRVRAVGADGELGRYADEHGD